jgi:hypothetical protein
MSGRQGALRPVLFAEETHGLVSRLGFAMLAFTKRAASTAAEDDPKSHEHARCDSDETEFPGFALRMRQQMRGANINERAGVLMGPVAAAGGTLAAIAGAAAVGGGVGGPSALCWPARSATDMRAGSRNSSTMAVCWCGSALGTRIVKSRQKRSCCATQVATCMSTRSCGAPLVHEFSVATDPDQIAEENGSDADLDSQGHLARG